MVIIDFCWIIVIVLLFLPKIIYYCWRCWRLYGIIFFFNCFGWWMMISLMLLLILFSSSHVPPPYGPSNPEYDRTDPCKSVVVRNRMMMMMIVNHRFCVVMVFGIPSCLVRKRVLCLGRNGRCIRCRRDILLLLLLLRDCIWMDSWRNIRIGGYFIRLL